MPQNKNVTFFFEFAIGFGNLTQGHMDIYILKRALLLWADEKSGKIDLASFVNQFFVLLDRNSNKEAMINDLERRKNSVTKIFWHSC